MFKYLIDSFKRKRARRITAEYDYKIDTFNLEKDGEIKFANWENPLVNSFVFNQNNIDFFKKYINEGDVVIDIGANIGDTTVPIAIAAGKKGLTFAFDPNPFVFKVLKANAKLNENKANIIPLMFAISTEEREFYYISSEASFANGGISYNKEVNHGKHIYPEKIKGINLMKFFEDKHPDKLDRISFIKIDTEGYDKEIIKSISDLIEKCKPIIIAESFGKSSDSEKKELYDVLNTFNYRIFHFEKFEKGTPIIEMKSSNDLIKHKQTIDVLAKPR